MIDTAWVWMGFNLFVLAMLALDLGVFCVFGALLVFTGIKMAVKRGEAIHPDRNLVVRAFKRLTPVTFVGLKMLVAHSPSKLDTLLSPGVVVGVLAVSVAPLC